MAPFNVIKFFPEKVFRILSLNRKHIQMRLNYKTDVARKKHLHRVRVRNKLACFVTTRSHASLVAARGLKSQHLILFVTYEWAQ